MQDALFIVMFEDAPGQTDARARHMADHLAFLDRTPAITAAGPLFDGPSAAGGLWLVRGPDVGAVQALVHADPFWPTGLRKSVRILEWRRVHADGQRA
jgi:uncharacterized protein YciI